MGNQLSSADLGMTVNIADINPKLAAVGPLGGKRRGRMMTALHCHDDAGEDVVSKLLLRCDGGSDRDVIAAHHDGLRRMDQLLRAKADGRRPATSAPIHLVFYTQMRVTDRACYLERPFLPLSVAERLGRRPMLSVAQRLFLCYQLLEAVAQLHDEFGVTHGDLKAENVLLSHHGWLYVADLAPFKPTFLDAGNPVAFEFYFDCAEQRNCSLAPERFLDEAALAAAPRAAPVTPSMEMFSAACVMHHILTDRPLFKLSDVLELRGTATHEARAAFVEGRMAPLPPGVSGLLVTLLLGGGEDPTCGNVTRPTAAEALERFTPSVFPRHFAFLHDNVLPALLSLPPDLALQFLWTRFDAAVEAAVRCESDPAFAAAVSARPMPDHGAPRAPGLVATPPHVAECVLGCVAVCCRSLLSADASVKAARLIERGAGVCGDGFRADVLLPLALAMARDQRFTPLCRAMALRAVGALAKWMRVFPASDSFLFEDYVLPSLAAAAALGDKAPVVLSALADALPMVAVAALHYIETREGRSGAFRSPLSVEAQRRVVLVRVWDLFRPLITHPNSAVVAAAVEAIPGLLPVLGVQFVAEHLFLHFMPLMVGGVEVRRLMVRRIVDCTLFMRQPLYGCVGTVKLLLTEALGVSDARTLHTALVGIRDIVLQRALPPDDTRALVQAGIAYLAHPHRWITHAAAELVATAAREMSPIDVLLHLAPARKMLTHPLPLSLLDTTHGCVRPEALLDARSTTEPLRTCQDLAATVPAVDVASTPPTATVRGSDAAGASDAVELTLDAARAASGDRSAADRMHIFAPTPRQAKRLQFRVGSAPTPARRRWDKVGARLGVGRRDARGAPPTTPAAVPPAAGILPANPVAATLATSTAGHAAPVLGCAAARHFLLTAAADATVRLWDLSETLKAGGGVPQMLLPQRLKLPAAVTAPALFAEFTTPEPTHAALGTAAGDLLLCDVGAPEKAQALTVSGNGAGGLSSCAVMDGRILFVGSHRGGLYGVDPRVGKDVWAAQLPPSHGPLTKVLTVGGDAPFAVVSAAAHGALALFDMRFRVQMLGARLSNCGQVRDAACVAGNPAPAIAVATTAGDVVRLSIATLAENLVMRPVVANSITALHSTANGQTLVSGGRDGVVRLWDMTVPEASRSLALPPDPSPEYNWNKGAATVAEAAPRHAARVPCTAARHVAATVQAIRTVVGPQGQRHLATACSDGSVQLWRNLPPPS